MGKRERRRQRETGVTRPKQRLGTEGAYMVCRECREPLTLYSLVNVNDETDEQKIMYIHPREYVEGSTVIQLEPYDHEAVPVEGTPLEASTTCDFCHKPGPRYVFVPRKPVRTPDLLHPDRDMDFSSPWGCCDGCLPAVKSRNMTRMLDRAMKSPYSVASRVPAEDRSFYRGSLRELYVQYLNADPAGPYELKIRPDHKPVGKPGSRRGMLCQVHVVPTAGHR